jgi:uncharacterized RDD family membrane protein YckC
MLTENSNFLIRGDDGQEYGPVGLEELRDWVQENRAGLGTEVKRDETGAIWEPWQNFPELVALLAEANVTSPVPGQNGLVIAPMGRRVLAFALDVFLASLLSMPPAYVIAFLSGIPDLEMRYLESAFQTDQPAPPNVVFYGLLSQLVSQVIFVLYFAGFIAAHGQTPGKAIFRLRVIGVGGQKPHFVKSFVRALALAVSTNLLFLPMAYAFFNPQRRAVHDIFAGTYVVEA